MKLIEKNSNRVVEIHMYIVDNRLLKSPDLANDFFDCAQDLSVNDMYYVIDYIKDWVAGKGDFAFEDCGGNRLAVIDGISYANFGI